MLNQGNEENGLRNVALTIFAITLFVFAIYNIANVTQVALQSFPFPGGIILVYFSAFVDLTICLSITSRWQMKKVCLIGGYFWAVMTLSSFISEVVLQPSEINAAIMYFFISLGYTAAIFYISSMEE